VRDRLAAAIGDPAVVVEPAADFTSSPVMSSDDAFERTYREIVGRYYLGAPIIHPMLTGASDSRFLRNKGVRAYGVVDRAATEEESMSGHTAHGPDERREIRWFATALAFLRELTRTMAM
jgi:acetylornithine deacetylase/succinyl-diaminopimelate desuccinylase-like protein